MTRFAHWLVTATLCVGACGPDRRDCTGPHPDFVVVLRLSNRPLAADTVVHVTYAGSGMEDYSVASPNAAHEVVFCRAATLDGGAPLDASSEAAAGATGQGDGGVDALRCELWTGGFANLQVRSSGLPATSYDLAPREHQCTVSQTLVLDSPDGG